MTIGGLRAAAQSLALGCLALGCLAIVPAFGQGLQVSPVTLELPAGQMAASFTVWNHGTAPTGMQVRAYTWTQDAGGDKLAPTAAIDVSPPIFEIPAAGAQLVRVVLRQPAARAEDAYRLLFDQIPSAEPQGVKLALRFSVPVFVEPAAVLAPALDLHIAGANGNATLVAANHGGHHDRIVNPSLTLAGSAIGLVANTNYYVLAGSEQRWALSGRLAALRPGAVVQLKASSLSGPLDQSVPVAGN